MYRVRALVVSLLHCSVGAFWSCICHVSFHLVVSHYRSSVSLLAFTLLCDETLRPPVGQRSPQPLKGTKRKESQPNQASNNVDGPHTSHDINILVVLEFAVKLPWLASRASFRLHLHESRKWPDDDRQHTLSRRSSTMVLPDLVSICREQHFRRRLIPVIAS